MQEMKSKVAIFAVIALFIIFIPCTALADGIPPANMISLMINGYSTDLYYVDILVSNALPNMHYDKPNAEILNAYPFLKNSDLLGLNNDGYSSYSLYYNNPKVDDNINKKGSIFDPKFAWNDDELNSIVNIKIVCINKHGKIIKLSEKISLAPNSKKEFRYGNIDYNFSGNRYKVYFAEYDNFFYTIGIILPILIRIFISTAIELFVAVLFRFRPYRVIIVANLASQALLTTGFYLLSSVLSYIVCIILFEMLVVAIEFFIYLKFIKNQKFSTILAYTLAANAASFILGLLLNSFGLIKG